MTCFQLRIAVAVLAALLVAWAGPDAAQSPQQSPTGGIDLESANRLVAGYARHVLGQLRGDWRRAEEKRWEGDPPRLGPEGLYQINGPAGRIAFEYDPDARRLLCWALVFKPQRDYPLIGLTRKEILAALERAAAAGVDTGGGRVAYEPQSDGFFLLRAYEQPPERAAQMAREIDLLTAAGARWSAKHYLEAVLSYAKTLSPPPSATARDGTFRVILVLTPDVRYHALWHRPPGAVQPQLVSRLAYTRGQEVWALALFSGATAGDDGSATYEAQYSFVYPDGKEAGSKVFTFWDAPPPPADHLQMVENRAAIELGADKPLGDYEARLKVCNLTTERCVVAVSPFRVTAGSTGHDGGPVYHLEGRIHHTQQAPGNRGVVTIVGDAGTLGRERRHE